MEAEVKQNINKSSEMSGFKLLAIRPLYGCDPKFLKNLNPQQNYQFYQDYSFEYDDIAETKNVKKINHKPIIPKEFYNIQRKDQADITINISAVVGKNGSGKSSLMELLFVSAFLLATQEGILKKKGGKNIENLIQELKIRKELDETELEGLFNKDNSIPHSFFLKYPYRKAEQVTIDQVYRKLILEKEIEKTEKELNLLISLSEEIVGLKNGLKVEIYYQISKTCFRLKIHPDLGEKNCRIEIVPSEFSHLETEGYKAKLIENTRINREKNIENILDLPLDLSEHFFYSIVLNYSHYALNSKELGIWINELFHKNDGYQTPIVINPMRDDGNIDINTENHLVRSRLLANIFLPIGNRKPEESQRCLVNGKIAKRVIIELDRDKFETNKDNSKLLFKNWNNYSKEYWSIIKEKFLLEDKTKRQQTAWDEAAREYILGKLVQISEKYPPYQTYSLGGKLINEKFLDYLNALENDRSHIAFKFHQAINFLKYDYAIIYEQTKSKIKIEQIEQELSPIANQNNIIYFVPPSFLKVDILFSTENDDDSFNHLSSGEKQKIYSTSSIVYHLRYLDSVQEKDTLRYKYQNINLIFDEIELYYHPELQRNFISDFRESVKRTPLLSIQNINCIFVTHSPFILSDIPHTNVLYLKTIGEPPKALPDRHEQQTFGANIHDLLANDFYMEDGFMGEFAKNKIKDIILYLDWELNKNDKNNLAKPTDKWDKISSKKVIDLIGEPMIKQNLRDFWEEVFPSIEN